MSSEDVDGRSARRGRIGIMALATLVVLAAAFVVWRVVDNPPPSLHPVYDTYDAIRAKIGGTYLSVDPAEDTTVRHATVRLPFGTEHVRTATPALEGVQSRGDDAVLAPPNGSFVSVEVTLDTSTSTVPVDLLAADSQAVTSTVVVAGRRYPLGRQAGVAAVTGQPDVVAVAGHPSSVSVEIGYDGVSQRVDMTSGKVTPGRSAAPLYRRAPAGTQTCGRASLTAGFRKTTATYPLDCVVSWRQVPYAPGRGWARPGSAWVLFSVTTVGPGAVEHDRSIVPVYSVQGLLTVTCGDGSTADDLDREAQYRNRDGVSDFICPQTSTSAISIAEKLETDAESPLVARWSTRLG